eukprot:m.117960 g.117960  ORF g.117960 m.117960 type:complete len:1450 (-) comp9335_c0_seq1:1880-6229(-)
MSNSEYLSDLNPKIPLTTRPPRDGETNGVQYHFVTKEKFMSLLDAGALLEHGERNENMYGSLRPTSSAYVSRMNSMRPKPKATDSHNLQTVLLQRSKNGSFNVTLVGGLQERSLIHVLDILPDCSQVSFSARPLRQGDAIIAIDGASVAGVGLPEAISLVKSSGDLVELLILDLSATSTHDYALTRFLEDDELDSDELKAVKLDVKRDIYGSIVPYTTREKREGEKEGEQYHFITKEQFQSLLEQDKFLEYGESNGVYYGTPHVKPSKFRQKTALNRHSFHRSTSRDVSVAEASPISVMHVEHAGNFASMGMELVNSEHGVFVADVEESSSAQKGGIRRGHQIMSVDGADLSTASVKVIRATLDRVNKAYDIGVRFNVKFADAVLNTAAGTTREDVFTTIIGRNSDNSWGIQIEGGVEEGELISFGEVTNLNNLSDGEIHEGDCLLAIDGTSVAGADLNAAIDLIQAGSDTLELTILSLQESAFTPLIEDFVRENRLDDKVIAAVKADVKSQVYRATVPYTTRAPREGEVDGDKYNFVTKEEFMDLQAEGRFCEWGENNGVYYGTLHPNTDTLDAVPISHARRTLRMKSLVHTAVLEQQDDGEWGITIDGGVADGYLPHISFINDNTSIVQYSEWPPRVNDVLLAINGISVAGYDSAYAREILDAQHGEVELALFSHYGYTKPMSFKQLFELAEREDTNESLKEIAADVKKDVYKSNVPYTTRSPLPGEVRGREYNFVSAEEFLAMEQQGSFIETGEANGVLYGTAVNQSVVSAQHKPRQSTVRHKFASRARRNRPRLFYLRQKDGKELGMTIASSNGEVYVASITADGAAHEAGIRVNMRVLKVDSDTINATNTHEDVQAMIENAFSSQDVTAVATSYLPAQFVQTARVPTYFSPAGRFVTGVRRIHAWCTPRSLSTPLMYAFAQRQDTSVMDEPFYAYYLEENPTVKHPLSHKVYEYQSTDPLDVLQKIGTAASSPVLFCKHVAKHYPVNVSDDWLDNSFHILLYRDPTTVVSKFSNVIPCTFKETAFADLVTIMTKLRARGCPFMVVNADDLVADPKGVLETVCQAAGLEFSENMLTWEAGPKEYDGIWGAHWYTSLYESTGFKVEHDVEIPPAVSPELRSIIADCYPFYLALQRNAHDFTNPTQESSSADETSLLWVGDCLVPRAYAKLSVLDSAVLAGDAVWEGMRVYNSCVLGVDAHIDHLIGSARALGFLNIPSPQTIQNAIMSTLSANDMMNEVYVRVLLSRGQKRYATTSPAGGTGKCTLVVVAESSSVDSVAEAEGVALSTASNRQVPSQCVDTDIKHTSMIAKVLPQLQASHSNVHDCILLDVNGYVCETTIANIFVVRSGQVETPEQELCVPGATRQVVIDIVLSLGQSVAERKLLSSALFKADEVFISSSFGEIVPVVKIDGRTIGTGSRGPVTEQVQHAFADFVATNGVPIRPSK